jgi:hypothetical protein
MIFLDLGYSDATSMDASILSFLLRLWKGTKFNFAEYRLESVHGQLTYFDVMAQGGHIYG